MAKLPSDDKCIIIQLHGYIHLRDLIFNYIVSIYIEYIIRIEVDIILKIL